MASKSKIREHDRNAEQSTRSRSELVVLLRPGADAPATNSSRASRAGSRASPLADVLARASATIRPLFTPAEGVHGPSSRDATPEAAELDRYYGVRTAEERLPALAEELRQLDTVEAAYVKPAGKPPDVPLRLNDMRPATEASPAAARRPRSQRTARLSRAGASRRRHSGGRLDPPWRARQRGVTVVDCEWSWNLLHEDLQHNQLGVVVGAPGGDDNHGTAVWGEIGGDRNQFGVTGSPAARLGAASFATGGSASVIRQAAGTAHSRRHSAARNPPCRPEHERTGSVRLHRDRVVAGRPSRDPLRRRARGGGRGGGRKRLSEPGRPDLSAAPAGFPGSWRNPFDPANPSSGARWSWVPGNPPSGTHGRTQAPDLEWSLC